MLGETFLEKFLDYLIIGYVAQVDDESSHIGELHACLVEQGFYIFPHAEGLLADISGMNNLSPMVDTGCTGDKGMATVTVIHTGSPFETDTVFVGRVEVCTGIKVADLFWRDAQYGIGIHQDSNLRVCMAAADTSTGNEVGFRGQVLGMEDLVTGLDYSSIIDINILDEEPGAQTVGGQRSTVLHQLKQVIIQQ